MNNSINNITYKDYISQNNIIMQIDLKNNLVINIILWLQISLIISGKKF